MPRQKFRLVRNPGTGELQWAPNDEGGVRAWLGWLILAVSTILFLVVAGYLVYYFLLTRPAFSVSNLPGGGQSEMGQEVQQLRSSDQHR